MANMKNIQKMSIVAAILCGSTFVTISAAVPYFIHMYENLGIELPTITTYIFCIPQIVWLLLGCGSVAGILLKDLWVTASKLLWYDFVGVTCVLVLTNIFWFALCRPFFSICWGLPR